MPKFVIAPALAGSTSSVPFVLGPSDSPSPTVGFHPHLGPTGTLAHSRPLPFVPTPLSHGPALWRVLAIMDGEVVEAEHTSRRGG